MNNSYLYVYTLVTLEKDKQQVVTSKGQLMTKHGFHGNTEQML